MIRILYALINVINQFCVIFGLAFNVGSLNCCKTNSSPFLKELKVEVHCAVHYIRTSVFPQCIHDHLQKHVVQDNDFT